MSRPLRLEFPGAVYHVTAGGNARQAIFADAADRERFLELLGREVFQVTVYLLRRACNVPLKEVAALAHVSPPRISQIQRAIDDAGGLGQAFAWATELERH